MNRRVRSGQDLILKLTINGSTFHTFDEIKDMQVLTQRDTSGQSNHTPTITSTNQCCNQNIPSYKQELSALVTSYSANTVVVESLFPADIQSVGGVYCLQLKWKEKTGELVADNSQLTYGIDIDDTIQFVETTSEADSSGNKLDFTFTFTK